MTEKLKKFKSKYNGSIRIVDRKSHPEKVIDKALHSLRLPKGVSYKQLKSATK